MKTYQQLEQRFSRIGNLDNANGLLGWDRETMMPDGAADSRAEITATLEVLSHELMTDPAVSDWLDSAEGTDGLDEWRLANLSEMRRRWRHATAVPADLVEANARAISKCEMAWRSARRDSDFAALLPSLSVLLDLQRQIAACKSESLSVPLYDALLDQWEPGGSSAAIDAMFADLADYLPGTVEAVLEHQARRPPMEPPQGPFPVAAQRDIGAKLMTAVGFDFERGRLDVSLHPFCGGGTNDVRITTRYDEDDFVKALMGVLHETGHALYEQGRPADWLHQPVGSALGMSMHESQSLIIEMQACRSREFLEYVAPLLREAFGAEGPAWSTENLHRLYTNVDRGFIRVDADEVTYPAHVILRYRLEKAMIGGDLALADLPGAWNDGMAELLGVVPPSDALGCLQDIHWPGGAWGYFPTYTLGAMAAAQLFEAACKAEPDVLPGIARGDFVPLVGWLRAKIHSHGSRLPADALMTEATGRPLDADAFKRHVQRRYLTD